MASAVCVSTDRDLLYKVEKEIKNFLPGLSRRETIERSLEDYGFLIYAPEKADALEAVNGIAPEHLEIQTEDPWKDMTKIKNAGAIFLGPHSSEPLGDYLAGPNHVLPTNGTARFFSALSVEDFVKRTSLVCYSREALEEVHNEIERFAEAEGLTAHANAVRVRFAGPEGGED